MRFRLEDFSPDLQAQILAKLGDGCEGARPTALPQASCGVCNSSPQRSAAESVASKKRRTPNKTEQRFAAWHLRNICHYYEGLTFHLSGGSRYTPDWVWWHKHRLHAAEVKGAYRLHSHGRARTAFKECAAQFPAVVFWWAAWTGNEWSIEIYNDTTSSIPA